MYLKRFFYTISLLFCLLTAAQEARASHAMGADLQYQCLGNNTYRIKCRNDIVVSELDNMPAMVYNAHSTGTNIQGEYDSIQDLVIKVHRKCNIQLCM